MWSSIITLAAELGLWILKSINASEEAKKRFLGFVDYAMKKGWVNSVKLKEEWDVINKGLENNAKSDT